MKAPRQKVVHIDSDAFVLRENIIENNVIVNVSGIDEANYDDLDRYIRKLEKLRDEINYVNLTGKWSEE